MCRHNWKRFGKVDVCRKCMVVADRLKHGRVLRHNENPAWVRISDVDIQIKPITQCPGLDPGEAQEITVLISAESTLRRNLHLSCFSGSTELYTADETPQAWNSRMIKIGARWEAIDFVEECREECGGHFTVYADPRVVKYLPRLLGGYT